MSFTYGFYNSVDGDRKYDAKQMSSIFNGIINDGVFMSIGTAFGVVQTDTPSMFVKVGVGRAWFNSTWSNNDAVLLVPVEAPPLMFSRVDTVVIEVNSTENVRANSIKIIKGTTAMSPVQPTLTNTEFINQYPLANLVVTAGTTGVTTSNITQRVGSSDTPYITGILETMDTDLLLIEWQAQFSIWLANIQTLFSETDTEVTNMFNQWTIDFNVWFAEIVDILDSNAAGNLLLMIQANTALINGLRMDLDATIDSLPTDYEIYTKVRRF